MRTLVTYWDGPVSWLERLSLASMLAAGYAVEVYAHDVAGLRRQGLHQAIVDVREVMAEHPMADLYRRRGNHAFYADYLRLMLMAQAKGIWADLDCVFRQPIGPPAGEADYVFGWLNPKRINNAVLHIPAGSELLRVYREALDRVPIRAPWATGHIRVKRELEILIGKTIPFDPDRLAIGPRALTYFIRRLGLEDRARPRAVFYPLGDDEAHLLTKPDDRDATALISPETVAVHAWRGKLWSIGQSGPPQPNSWLGQRCRDYGV
jgi:hypothetical protein